MPRSWLNDPQAWDAKEERGELYWQQPEQEHYMKPQWDTSPPPQRHDESRLGSGSVALHVSQAADGEDRRWQYISLQFGRHTTATHAECLRDWPRQAIALARAELDRFEASLDEEQDDES